MPTSHTAFVLGNGVSRESINLNELREHGTIYGCNAIYREFKCDHLIAVDTKMVLEIAKTNYQKYNSVWTNPSRLYKNIPNLNYFNPSKGWSSGPTALWYASQNGHREIFILGFDYKGIGERQDRFNNIYADTINYKKSDEPATFHGNWLRQTANVVKEHSIIKYTRVITPYNFCPSELNKFRNISNIMVEDFKKIFNLS
jgi:hypothetical protein